MCVLQLTLCNRQSRRVIEGLRDIGMAMEMLLRISVLPYYGGQRGETSSNLTIYVCLTAETVDLRLLVVFCPPQQGAGMSAEVSEWGHDTASAAGAFPHTHALIALLSALQRWFSGFLIPIEPWLVLRVIRKWW